MGRPVDEIVGRTIPEVIGVVGFETLRPHITRVLSGESVDFEAQVPYRDLGARWIRAGYVPTHDAAGETDGWVAVITDTTEQRKMEDALRQADRRKDEFLAVLAHELRNPLAPIRSALHVLRMTNKRDPTTERVASVRAGRAGRDSGCGRPFVNRTFGPAWHGHGPDAAVFADEVDDGRAAIEGGGHHLAVVIPPEPITL
jgi:signal transduction histidine kinase